MTQKVILITGTNSGFGWLHVHTLSKAGHKVYATVRDVAGRNATKAADLKRLPNVSVLEADLTDSATVDAAVEAVIAAEARIDVLINNAGNFTSGIAETFTDEDVDFLFDVHFKGTWRTIKQVLPHMRQQGEGLIINTSSVLGRFSSPFMSFYNAAKFAVEGLSEGLRYELRPLGIDVAIIQPGAFPTEIFGKAGQGSDSSVIAGYGELANIPEQIGVGMGQLFETAKPNAQDVADAVLRLIELPKGQRPLRTVVDGITGKFVVEANDRVREGHREFVSAFGLQALLD
jgi:NAD(P)-dependent dehydrogenase (short-subunit alcohol dehydrogenase family)